MRKVVHLLCLLVISFGVTTMVAPKAVALPQYSIEILYFNYGAGFYTAEDISTCGGMRWTSGNFTPHEGALKRVVVTECFTHESTEEWYRYSAIDCPGYTPGWYLISQPSYYISPWPC